MPRPLDENAIRDIAYGSAVLGTGGGGDPYLGTLASLEAARSNGPPVLVDADELADDATVVFPFVVGSPVPGVEKLSFGPELPRVLHSLEEYLGRRIDAVMSAEIGGANSMVSVSKTGACRRPMRNTSNAIRSTCCGSSPWPSVTMSTFIR